jgi:hypothetical protein
MLLRMTELKTERSENIAAQIVGAQGRICFDLCYRALTRKLSIPFSSTQIQDFAVRAENLGPLRLSLYVNDLVLLKTRSDAKEVLLEYTKVIRTVFGQNQEADDLCRLFTDILNSDSLLGLSTYEERKPAIAALLIPAFEELDCDVPGLAPVLSSCVIDQIGFEENSDVLNTIPSLAEEKIGKALQLRLKAASIQYDDSFITRLVPVLAVTTELLVDSEKSNFNETLKSLNSLFNGQLKINESDEQ